MDPIRNPYAPGAGSPPPALAGRDQLRERVRVALERIRSGRAAKSVILIGLRGVGKTVLLDRLRDSGEESGFHTIRVEAPEDRSLPSLLAPMDSASGISAVECAEDGSRPRAGDQALAYGEVFGFFIAELVERLRLRVDWAALDRLVGVVTHPE